MKNNKSQSNNSIHYSKDVEKFKIAVEKARITRITNKEKNYKTRKSDNHSDN